MSIPWMSYDFEEPLEELEDELHGAIREKLKEIYRREIANKVVDENGVQITFRYFTEYMLSDVESLVLDQMEVNEDFEEDRDAK